MAGHGNIGLITPGVTLILSVALVAGACWGHLPHRCAVHYLVPGKSGAKTGGLMTILAIDRALRQSVFP